MNTNSRLNRYNKNKERKIPSKTTFKVLRKGFSVGLGLLFFFIIPIMYIIFPSSFKDYKFSDNSPVIEGRVTNIESSGVSFGDNKIYKYEFEYTVDGINYQSKSYCQGEKEYDSVSIEYLPNNSSVSRIKGMTIGVLPPATFFIFFFMQLIALIVFIVGLLSNLGRLKYMKIGEVAILRVSSIEELENSYSFLYKYFFIDVNNRKFESSFQSEAYSNYKDTIDKTKYASINYGPILYKPKNPDKFIYLNSELKDIIPNITKEIEAANKRDISYLEKNTKAKSINDFDDLRDKIRFLLKTKKVDKAINLSENDLKKLPKTKFHEILGKDLLKEGLISATKKNIDNYHKSLENITGKDLQKPAAYLCAIRNFQDEGKIIYDIFSYKKKGDDNLEWLNDENNKYEIVETNSIEDYTEIMDFYKRLSEDSDLYNPDNEKPFSVCYDLIFLRIIEHFTEVYKNLEECKWSEIPMFIIDDEDDFLIYKIN